ncbi:uncharacterized protein LOC121797646 isoform X2 [Salvia splendens]|uniref:uncharacterized protein LOC121797646 isoform X2 n=1 Tax=Salvia splendens TaxID=180675 RepID=UPI001C260809|nr:uncharacterized protein LOC121797646 isoform X2 [Salvia splendens]
MGREWLYWIGGTSSRRRRAKQEESTSAGCMCAVFQLFDIPLNHQHSLHPFLQQEATTFQLKGVEAPRNSLELEEPPPIKQEDNSNFPGGIQIKTRASISRKEDSESIDSPSTKTPNLVARLMGLDLLPESNNSSPSFYSPNSKPAAKSHLNKTRCFYDDDIKVGARSLPETPRMEYHRLSLQISKDNSKTNDEFKSPRSRFRQQQQDENRSPGHYAKQILKQVKESVSRRVGLVDITNTNRDEIRRDQNLITKHSNKNSIAANDGKQSSPKLRISDTNKSPRNSTSSDTNPPPPPKPKHHPPHKENRKMGVKIGPKSSDQAIRNKKEEAFIRSPAPNKMISSEKKKKKKKSKKAPLSSELIHLSGPTIVPVKKGPSPPATKLPQKQQQPQVSDALSSKRNTQLSSYTSRSYKQPDKIFATAPGPAEDYRGYIQKILKRSGIIDKLTPLTLGKWHTPSHPLDPSIFYYLELFHPAAAVLSRRCNRKLIFQLVDEILADILRPHLDYKPWIHKSPPDQFSLVDDLCERIGNFPGKDCQVLEDIDLLVEKDLRKTAVNGYFEEEGERLVREVEGEIVERLLIETVADGVRTERQRRWAARDQIPRQGIIHVA